LPVYDDLRLIYIGMNFSAYRTMSIIEKTQQVDFVTRLTFIKGRKGIVSKHVNRVKKKRKFKTWCMPEQASGYIRCRPHDFF